MASDDGTPVAFDDPEPIRQGLVRLRDGWGEEVLQLRPATPVLVEKKGLFGKVKQVEAEITVQVVWYGSPEGEGGYLLGFSHPPGPPLSQRVVPFPDGARLAYETDEAASVELADELSPAAAAKVIAYLAGVFLAAYGQTGMRMDSLEAPGSVGD